MGRMRSLGVGFVDGAANCFGFGDISRKLPNVQNCVSTVQPRTQNTNEAVSKNDIKISLNTLNRLPGLLNNFENNGL